MVSEKNNMIPIGVPGAPWPTMIRHEKKTGNQVATTFELGVMEDPDNPMILPSGRPYPEVMGEFYRNMPVPSMLPALEFVVSRASPENKNRIANLVSDPGTGKSFLAVSVGIARDARGPIITDAGGKNLEYLLFETVFDVEESKPLTKAIDEALSNNKLDQLCVDALRQNFGKHFSEEDGRICVDWRGLVADPEIGTEKIRETLELIRSVEGWDAKKLGIGFKTKKGPLVVAHEEGRDLVIDELNKCKPGSETPLQIVWQVLNGEIAEHTVTLGSNGTFTFKKGQGGLVICTGNLPKDGIGTHLISESFDRRVPGYRIPNFDEQDWQHRICQKMTGLPISTLHRMQKGKWQTVDGEQKWVIDNPEGFTKLLLTLRTLGQSEEQKRNVPDWQMSMIANWQGVLDASERLAGFYFSWSQLVDPESAVLKSGNMSSILMEVDSPENPTSKITPSTMIRNIEDAIEIKPMVKEVNRSGGFDFSRNWNEPLKLNELEKEPAEVKFGDRLSQQIMDEVYRTSAQVGKKQLYAQLRNEAENAGLLGDNPPISAFLNVDPTKVQGSTAQAKRIQGILTDYLRSEYPDMELSSSDEDVLPLRQVQDTMANLAEEKQQEISPLTTVLYVPNADLNTVEESLFKKVTADNLDPNETLEQSRIRHPADSLISRGSALTALAMPTSGILNIKALFNKALTNGAPPSDEATAIAQNQSPSEVAMTTVICRNGKEGEAKYTKLHVLYAGKIGRTLIVGDGNISNDLRSQLKRNGVTYVDQNNPSSETTVNSEIRSMLDTGQEAVVHEAFLMRNQLGPGVDEKSVSLAQLMVKPEQTRSTIPNFISSVEPPQTTHAQKAEESKKKGIASWFR